MSGHCGRTECWAPSIGVIIVDGRAEAVCQRHYTEACFAQVGMEPPSSAPNPTPIPVGAENRTGRAGGPVSADRPDTGELAALRSALVTLVEAAEGIRGSGWWETPTSRGRESLAVATQRARDVLREPR